jgi:hypothetical protein
MSATTTPLVDTLRDAVAGRRRALRFGWSRRKDHDDVTRALMLCEQFLMSYPYASDALVRNWCRDHQNAVACVVLGGRTTILYKLLGHG